MSHSIGQIKMINKIQHKANRKSSLPHIDQLQNTKTKFATASPSNPAFKNLRKFTQNHQPASNIAKPQLQAQTYETITSNSQREQHNNKTLIIEQKQLNTATTVHIQSQVNFKDSDIKDSEMKGLDMWTLNRNLKQFSQTRKIAFFKNNKEKQKLSIPSTINKNKTQQIKSMYKIYAAQNATIVNSEKEKSQTTRKNFKIHQNITRRKSSIQSNPYSTLSKKKNLSILENTLYGTLPVRKQRSDLNSTLYTKETKIHSENTLRNFQTVQSGVNPYLRTFINGSHLKRQPSNRKLQILQLKNFSPRKNQAQTQKSKGKKPQNLRRNRFEKISKDQIQQNTNKDIQKQKDIFQKTQKQNQNLIKKESIKSGQQDKSLLLDKKCFDDEDQDVSEKGQYKKVSQYARILSKINENFLVKQDNYIENYQVFSTIPPSKIQYMLDSVPYPEVTQNVHHYKSVYKANQKLKNDLQFITQTTSKNNNSKQKGKNVNQNNKKKQSKSEKGGQKRQKVQQA